MKTKIITVAFCELLCLAVIAAEYGQQGRIVSLNFTPKDGFVPNEATAIKIAVAVWEPIYGAEYIAGEKPYQARLTNDVWIVEGSLPEDAKGGVAEAQIAKTDGKILNVSHGK